jgi:hypothetical protein
MLGFHEIVRKKKCIKDKLQRVYVSLHKYHAILLVKVEKVVVILSGEDSYFPQKQCAFQCFFLRYVETNACDVFINTMLINNTKHLVNCTLSHSHALFFHYFANVKS